MCVVYGICVCLPVCACEEVYVRLSFSVVPLFIFEAGSLTELGAPILTRLALPTAPQCYEAKLANFRFSENTCFNKLGGEH